jgi:lysophospholipase L1-like esterase
MCVRSFICSIALGLLATQAAFAASTTDPVPREQEGWVKRHESMNERVKQGNVDLLMIGDSITHGWEVPGKETWAELYEKRNAVNLGISGDRTEHVLWRLQNGNIDGITPKAAVIMIGTNNLSDNTAPEIADGVGAIVKLLREKQPQMKILLLAVFPRDEKPGTDNRKEIGQLNKLLRKNADGKMVTFLNINKAFLDKDGVLSKKIMPDALHPNQEGYKLWGAAMEPKLREVLGETDGAKALFNGVSLNGWEQVGGDKSCWFTAPGLLYTDGVEGGGWLSTKKEYGDFELSLEYLTPKGGNSGVFIRAPREGNPAFEGSEIQVLDDADEQYKDLQPYQYTGSVYSTCAPSKRVTKPAGEWQSMKIRCEGPRVQVWVNGEQVVDCNQDEAAKDEAKLKEHPGLKRYKGYIGLQNHSSRLDYRNVFIKEL